MKRLEQLVSEYLRSKVSCERNSPGCHNLRPCCDDEFPPMPTIADAIEIAALSLTKCGNVHPHQRRIPCCVRREFAASLSDDSGAIAACTDFDTLYDRVWEVRVKGRVKGVGPLFAYDVSLRVAKGFLGIWPKKVYLHAGAARGARALVGRALLRRRVCARLFPETVWRRLGDGAKRGLPTRELLWLLLHAGKPSLARYRGSP